METTRESARQESHKELVKNLQGLLETNYDAEKGYRKALNHAHDPNLKGFIKNQAFLHGRFATEIDKLLHSLNERPKEHSSILGVFHRKWIDFRSSFNKKDDNIILEECIRGEKVTLKEYDEKFSKYKFPASIKSALKDQYTQLKDSINDLKTIDDLHSRT